MTKRMRVAFDPRLAVGLLLVAASVAGVVLIVAAADDSVPLYAARSSLVPGDRIGADDLAETSVRLPGAPALYLQPGEIPPGGYVVTKPVAAGELVPASAVGSVDGLRLTSVVLAMDGALAASVQPGSTVDIWAAPGVENGKFGPPAVIVPGATVVRLVESDSIVGAGETTGVEVLVPKSRIARVLEALANDEAVSIVPATLPGRS